MKLSEFALNFNVSERHARRLLQENEVELSGHYDRRGREGTFLDDVAVDFLKNKLQKSFDVVINQPSERERQLESQITELSMRYAAAMEQMVKNAGAVALLEASKENVAKLEARASEAEERAELRERELHELEQQFGEERARAETKVNDLQAQLDQIAGAGWWERRKLLKQLKRQRKE